MHKAAIFFFNPIYFAPLDLPTEREMDLWAELQATKDTLRITEDEVTACKREKVKFLETLTKITVPTYLSICLNLI